MNDSTALSGFRLMDSFLPVGANSASYGLEQFIATDRVSNSNDLCALLKTYLNSQFAKGELIALRVANVAAINEDLRTVMAADQRLNAVSLTAEFRKSSQLVGKRLLQLQCDLRDDTFLSKFTELVNSEKAYGTHAVVLGIVTGREGIPAYEACLMASHSFMTEMLGAAQRLLQLGHTEVQQILDNLRPAIVNAVEASINRSLEEMAPFAPVIETLSAEHESADRRLFMS